jgi:DNA-binding response OmpR family regulator
MRDIVLVHSNEKMNELYKRKLGQYFRVGSAFDGLTGLRLIRNTKPHMLITEYDLPWMSGLGLLKYVRKTLPIAHIPVIVVSHRGATEEALQHGANEWVKTSDTSVEELMNKVFYHLITNKIIK